MQLEGGSMIPKNSIHTDERERTLDGQKDWFLFFYIYIFFKENEDGKIKKQDYGWPDRKIATNHGPDTM